MLIHFLTFNIYKYALPLFLIYSFHNDDMKSSKRHVVLLSLFFLLKHNQLSYGAMVQLLRAGLARTTEYS